MQLLGSQNDMATIRLPVFLPLFQVVFTHVADVICTPIGLISLSASYQLQSAVGSCEITALVCEASPRKTL